jgi:hypothetical protein
MLKSIKIWRGFLFHDENAFSYCEFFIHEKNKIHGDGQ